MALTYLAIIYKSRKQNMAQRERERERRERERERERGRERGEREGGGGLNMIHAIKSESAPHSPPPSSGTLGFGWPRMD